MRGWVWWAALVALVAALSVWVGWQAGQKRLRDLQREAVSATMEAGSALAKAGLLEDELLVVQAEAQAKTALAGRLSTELQALAADLRRVEGELAATRELEQGLEARLQALGAQVRQLQEQLGRQQDEDRQRRELWERFQQPGARPELNPLIEAYAVTYSERGAAGAPGRRQQVTLGRENSQDEVVRALRRAAPLGPADQAPPDPDVTLEYAAWGRQHRVVVQGDYAFLGGQVFFYPDLATLVRTSFGR